MASSDAVVGGPIEACAQGASFRRADLQIHTPIDREFVLEPGFSTSSEADKEKVGSAYIEAAEKAGLGILGISEHNDLTFFPYIRAAAQRVGIIVFPGVEFSLPPGLHIIALFEPDADVGRLWDCVVKMGLGRDYADRFHSDGSPKQAQHDLGDAIEIVAEYGGIVIAPHACGNGGLLCLPKGQHRVDSWKEARILAADPGNGRRVSELSSFEQAAFMNTHDLYRRQYPMPAIWTSDARSLDKLGGVFTWIKLGTPTIEGLRQAFLDPESRLRHCDDPVAAKYARIVGMAWEGNCFLAGQGLRFNESLNCLIGGKGTGKSSVIETLRFAFDMKPPSEMTEQTRSLLASVLPGGSKVTVIIETAEPKQIYVVERVQGGFAPTVRDHEGNVQPGIAPTDFLWPSIFGQKEVYTIALRRADQLRVLDEFLGEDVLKLNEEEAGIHRNLRKNATALVELASDTDEIAQKMAALPRLEAAKKQYVKAGIAAKLQRKTQYTANVQKLTRVDKKLRAYSQVIEKTQPTLDSEYTALPAGEPLYSKLNAARDILTAAAEDWRETAKAVMDRNAQRIAKVGTLVSEAKSELQGEEAAFAKVLEALEKEFPDVNLDQYLELERHIEELRPLGTELTQKQAMAASLRTDRLTLLDKLLQVRRNRFQLRAAKATELSDRLKGSLRIGVNFQGSGEKIRSFLDDLKTGIKKSAIEALVTHQDFSLPAFLQALDTGPEGLVDQFDLTDTTAQKLIQAIQGETRYELDALGLPDLIAIEFNVGSDVEPQYRGLEQLSVGQKSTAILLLLLLRDETPFVIDQPEDDLDNRFIYEDIVTRLRAAKNRRQFLVATHNANIPVLGDAEQIIVLNASSDRGFVDRTGSIDDVEIQDRVKTILEGGTQAFEMRKQKYGF